MDGGLGSPAPDLDGLDAFFSFSSVFFFPNPNKLRFLDFGSVFARFVPLSFSLGSRIVGVESPVPL